MGENVHLHTLVIVRLLFVLTVFTDFLGAVRPRSLPVRPVGRTKHAVRSLSQKQLFALAMCSKSSFVNMISNYRRLTPSFQVVSDASGLSGKETLLT